MLTSNVKPFRKISLKLNTPTFALKLEHWEVFTYHNTQSQQNAPYLDGSGFKIAFHCRNMYCSKGDIFECILNISIKRNKKCFEK